MKPRQESLPICLCFLLMTVSIPLLLLLLLSSELSLYDFPEWTEGQWLSTEPAFQPSSIYFHIDLWKKTISFPREYQNAYPWRPVSSSFLSIRVWAQCPQKVFSVASEHGQRWIAVLRHCSFGGYQQLTPTPNYHMKSSRNKQIWNLKLCTILMSVTDSDSIILPRTWIVTWPSISILPLIT